MRSLLTLLAFVSLSCAQTPDFRVLKDQDYTGAKNERQMLDLYLPKEKPAKPLPLVVYIHGGGWEGGAKQPPGVLLHFIRESRYIGASLNYRLTNEASWPAQIHDVKAAIRWLRGHAAEHGIDKERIAVFGISAGGHLVSLLGTSGGVKELEGDLGDFDRESSRVSCVLDFCGPSNFLTFYGKGSIIKADDPQSAIAKLLGGPLSQRMDAGRAASPVNYVTKDDPPFLLIHGTADNLVPYAQATEFDAALEKAGVSSTLITGTDAPHVFFTPELVQIMGDFIDKHLSGKDVTITEKAISPK
ncbi:MAG: alpha/beta hydrolase [Verrucomicrobiaceae bacterium]|nr:alpha/beta hydrolase [Verrucomicrobiaceae bacterium]